MSLLPVFESVARVAIAILVNGLWQGALIAFVAWLALRIFNHANASTRYAVWALALAGVIVVPIATSLSRVSVDTPASETANTSTSAPIARTSHTSRSNMRYAQTSLSRVKKSSPASLTNAAVPVVASHRFHVAVPSMAAVIVFGLWLLAALVVLFRLAIAMVSLERLKRDALPLAVDYRDAMPRWEAALKGHRDVRLCVSDDVEVPVAIGLFDSMILLPAHLVHSLEPSEVDQISLHELAHLLRADDWTNGLQRVACALLFFNPAVWFIARQLDIEREVACDDFVLQLTGAVRPYAFCLTKMAEMTAWPHRAIPAPGVFVTRKNISIRIERLLRTGRAIGSSIAPSVAAAVTVALLAIFFLLRTMTPSIAFTEFPQAAPAVSPLQPAALARVLPPGPHHASATVFARAAAPPSVAVTVTLAPVAPPDTSAILRQERDALSREQRDTLQSRQVASVVKESVKESISASTQAQAKAMAAALTPPVPQVAQEPRDGRSGPDCTGCDYANANMVNKDFSNRTLEGTNFSRADLHGSRFDHATLTGVNFKDANLEGVSFAGASMEGCNLKGARLAGARFDGAQLTGCNIDPRALSPDQARVVLSSCEGCNFAHADLHGMDLRNVHLEGADLAYADLRGTDLRGAMFTGVNFAHARLAGANVDNTDFTGCDFAYADLRNVDLSKASMTGSTLGNAIMRD